MPNAKCNRPERKLDNESEGYHEPFDKFINNSHALAKPGENRAEDMQDFDARVDDGQDECTAGNHELSCAPEMNTGKLIKQQLCADVKDNDVSRRFQNWFFVNHSRK